MSARAFTEYLQQRVDEEGVGPLLEMQTHGHEMALLVTSAAEGLELGDVKRILSAFLRNWEVGVDDTHARILKNLARRLSVFVAFKEFWPTEDDTDAELTFAERVAFAQVRVDAIRTYIEVLRDIRELTTVSDADLPKL